MENIQYMCKNPFQSTLWRSAAPSSHSALSSHCLSESLHSLVFIISYKTLCYHPPAESLPHFFRLSLLSERRG